MPDLPSVTNFINSPPGQLVAGAALAGIVWKVFERVEGVLTDQAKFEIAVWLVGVNLGKSLDARTTYELYISIWGIPRSWKRMFTTLLFSIITMIFIEPPGLFDSNRLSNSYLFLSYYGLIFQTVAMAGILAGAVTVAARKEPVKSKWEARFENPPALHTVLVRSIAGRLSIAAILIAVAFVIAHGIGLGSRKSVEMFCLLSLLGTSWLWLPITAGTLLKIAHRFDLGFDWFNRRFDIEKKPLSAIGLVAGSLVALLFWTWAVFRHFVPA